MSSAINTANPVTGSPTTASVRANFSAAKSEIEALQTEQALKAPLASPTFTGTATIPTAAVTTFTLGGVTVTATAAELNILDGVTSTAAELNKLDGATVTTAEINTLAGATGVLQTRINNLEGAGYLTTVAFGDLTSTPTTLSGYGITDAATSAQGTLADSAVQPNDAATLTSLTIGAWTIGVSGSTLTFSNGSTRMSLDASGNLTVDNDITAFGTP